MSSAYSPSSTDLYHLMHVGQHHYITESNKPRLENSVYSDYQGKKIKLTIPEKSLST